MAARLAVAGLLLVAAGAHAADKFCSDAPYFGVIDGAVLASAPTQISVDSNCTFRNWPQSKPLTTTINFNFQSGDPLSLIVFENVYYVGNMACSNTDSKFKIWFTNSATFAGNNSCQDLFIPVEKIDKHSPAATATVGIPFTYTLTIPVMFDPATGTTTSFPSANDLGNIHVSDDLTAAATGAEMTLVGVNAYYKVSGTPIAITNSGDAKHLDFTLPDIAKGQQVVVEVTVVLDNVAGNSAGTVFSNVAKWEFSRAVDINEDGVISPGEFFNPLPGEAGVAQAMTIAEPSLLVSKDSTTTALNLADTATYVVSAQNAGGSEAWNVTLQDRLPAGMCATSPLATLSARIVAADGVTLVRNLAAGSDYSASFSGAPSCLLGVTLTDAAGAIAPTQRLLISYDGQLDPGFTSDGATLTNVAGATGWYNGGSGEAGRRGYLRTLTDGSPGVLDFQDSQTVTAGLSGYYFEKSVQNLATGDYPATTAAPGDRLRYRVRLFNVDQSINGITISDTLDVANSFVGASFGNIVLPAGATYTFNASTGQLVITGAPLNVTPGGQLEVSYEITLRSGLANGSVVSNQASLAAAGSFAALSDDPYVNGVADPVVAGDEDPTRVTIVMPGPLAKANPAKTTAAIGERFSYRVTVPATPSSVALYDVRILDNLAASGAGLRFVSAAVVSGGGWTLANTSGSDSNLVIQDSVTGIDIPAGGQAVIDITVELQNTLANQRGLTFANTASYTYDRVNGSAASQRSGSGATTAAMTVVEPVLAAGKVLRFVSPASKTASDPATVGDVLEYTVTLANSGDATAFDTTVSDLPATGLRLVAGSAAATVNGVAVAGFVTTPTVRADGTLVWGAGNGDGSLDIPAGQSLVLTYRATVESVTGAAVANRAWGDWTSLQGSATAERSGAGCPVITQPNDYCSGPATATVSTVDNTFLTKAAVADTFAEVPASTGDPAVRVGDTVTYQLTLHLQEFTTRSVRVQDLLPAGLALQSATITAAPSMSYTLAAQPAAGATGTLLWDFGDIVNAPSNDGTPLDTLVIEYVARVLPDAPPVGVDYSTSVLSDNVATLAYTGGDPAAAPARLRAAERVQVRQPVMGALTKVDTGTGRTGTGTAASPYQVRLASDVMKFHLNTCNTGLAPAYGVTLSDLLAPQLDEGSLAAAPPVVKIGTTTLVAGADYSYLAPARGGELRITLGDSAPVAPGACVTVDYNLGFHTDVTTSTTWSNQARVAGYGSLPAGAGRLYAAGAAAQVWMTNLASPAQLLKTLMSPAEATIGDEVLYEIRVPATPMNIALTNVLVSDTLHAALEYVGATATLAGAPLALVDTSAAPGQVSLGIAAIPAGQQAVITLRTRVANNAQANAGASVANTASYTYSGMPPGTVTASTSAPFVITEPLLSVAKAASVTTPAVGDVITYTVTLRASGAGAGDSFSPARDLSLQDSLGLGLAYVAGSARLNGGALADPQVTGDGSNAAQFLSWDPANGIDIDLAEGATATVTYQARVLAGVAPGQSLGNSVVARWTGRDGASAFERNGSGAPAVNDYFTAPATVSVSTPLAFGFVKSVLNVSTGQNPGANASPGDTLRYTLVLSNQSVVPVTGANVVDSLAGAFAPGSLQLVSVSDAGADSSATTATGGSSGSGLVDVRNLTLGPVGDATATRTLVFEARLAAVLPNASTVANQAAMLRSGQTLATSNAVSTQIASAPQWVIQKTSQDLTGDSTVLLPGDTLAYTITVRNTGNENATGVTLRDLVPAFTAYVPGSTRLNGVIVADPASGVSALRDGLLIRAAGATTPGRLPADASAGAGSLATISFSVTVNSGAVAGTIIANQGAVNGAGEGGSAFPEQLSDDPATAAAPDPTRDIVGALPLLDAQKVVAIVVDNGTAGVADPGDVLRYTLTIGNTSAIAATGVTLTDAVPANTTYVADSTRLNGAAAGQPDGGVSPLAAGLAVNSAGAPAATVAGNATATVVFDVQVNAGVAAGTVISNQGSVASVELPLEPTDADGIDSNGDQPTTLVVGSAQQLSIVKSVSVVGGGLATAGGFLDYTVRVSNTGAIPATQVLLQDDVASLGIDATYVAGSALLDGSSAGVSVTGTLISADYAAVHGALAVGASTQLRFRMQIGAGVAAGTTLSNTGSVSWNTPTLTATSTATLAVGAMPGTVTLNGQAWLDANLDRIADSGEPELGDWTVQLFRGGSLLGSARTDAAGRYQFAGLAPATVVADAYELRFLAPGAGPATASLGRADSAFSNGQQRITGITGSDGSNVQGLNLPITPNGVVYDALLRSPVPGATLTLVAAGSGAPVAGGCFEDPLQQGQVTTALGFYKFDINFSDASCPSGGNYLIQVTPPPSGYVAGPSQLLPPTTSAATAAFDLPSCPGGLDDAVPATATACEAQVAPLAPAVGVAAGAGTRHYLQLALTSAAMPGSSQIYNNHLPLDPRLDNTLAISKTSALVNVSRSQLVPYVIRVRNPLPVALTDLRLADRFPAGFKYVAGSARLDGVAVEPVSNGRELDWSGVTLGARSEHVLKLLMVVGAGVGEGEYVNRAQVFSTVTGGAASGEARAIVRVVPDPTFDCTDVIGKVFDDANLNGVQDQGEAGLPGVRLATARGLLITTDAHGRFHLTCVVAPDERRGANFIVKLDDRTLPSGYRVTTGNPEVLRATRGKMLKFSFGAALHKVVRLDLANGVFAPDSDTMRLQWTTRLPLLLETLKQGPAVLRLAYMAETEPAALVTRRLEAVKAELARRWAEAGNPYELTIETEVFWRTGAPPKGRSAP